MTHKHQADILPLIGLLDYFWEEDNDFLFRASVCKAGDHGLCQCDVEHATVEEFVNEFCAPHSSLFLWSSFDDCAIQAFANERWCDPENCEFYEAVSQHARVLWGVTKSLSVVAWLDNIPDAAVLVGQTEKPYSYRAVDKMIADNWKTVENGLLPLIVPAYEPK